MNRKTYLTDKEKIMNMLKLGIVICAKRIAKDALMRCISYTLCEFESRSYRNINGNDFAVYRCPIIRKMRPALVGIQSQSAKWQKYENYGFSVIPVQTAMGGAPCQIPFNPLRRKAYSGNAQNHPPVTIRGKTIPRGLPIISRKSGAFLGGCAALGGCHE